MDIATAAGFIQELNEAVSNWRLREYILLSFYALHVYYYFTTIKEEIAAIHSHKWSGGRILFVILRYVTTLQIGINLATVYPTHFHISPKICKSLSIASDTSYGIVNLTVNVALGLCLSALLGLGPIWLAIIVSLCAAYPLMTWIFNMVKAIQAPTEEASILDMALGYPCYAPSGTEKVLGSVAGIGRDIRTPIKYLASVNDDTMSPQLIIITISLNYLAIYTSLSVVAVATFFIRYKGENGRLLRVLRRDGGLYYLTVSVARFVVVFVYALPGYGAPEYMTSSLAYLFTTGLQEVVVPILAQRLLINVQNANCIGSRSLASTLLFARASNISEESLEQGPDSDRMAEAPPLMPSESVGEVVEEEIPYERQLSAV